MTPESAGVGNTSSADIDPLGRLADEFAERIRRGEHPSVSEYAERYSRSGRGDPRPVPGPGGHGAVQVRGQRLPRPPPGRPTTERRSSGWATT